MKFTFFVGATWLLNTEKEVANSPKNSPITKREKKKTINKQGQNGLLNVISKLKRSKITRFYNPND